MGKRNREHVGRDAGAAAAMAQRLAAPRLPRLTTPMVRDSKDASLRPATWDEALDKAAAGLGVARSAIQAGSPNAFGMFSCSKATNEVNYLGQKFARMVMGSNNIDSCNRT